MHSSYAALTGVRRFWLAILLCSFIAIGWPMMARAQGCTAGACLTVGSNLVNVDTGQSELLDSLLNGLLGLDSNIDLSAGNYNELLNGSIGLLDLLETLQVDLGLQNPGEVLTTSITLDELLQAAADVADANGDTALVAVLNDLVIDIPLTQTIQLGDLLDLQLGTDSLSNIDLNALDLVTGSIQLFNFTNVDGPTAGVSIPGVALTQLGLDDTVGAVTLIARVLEPPTFICAPEGATFNSAPIRLLLDVTLLDLPLDTTALDTGLLGVLGGLLGILGDIADVTLDVNATLGDLSLLVEVGRGEGVIQTIDAISNAVTIEATPGVANLYLGTITDTLVLSRTYNIDPVNDLDFATIGSLDLSINFGLLPLPPVNIADVSIGARGYAEGTGSTSSFTFTGPYPQTHEFVAGASSADTLIDSLLSSLEVELDVSLLESGLGGLLGGDSGTFINDLLDGILGLLNNSTDGLLDGVLGELLGDLLNPLLDTLGIRLGEMGVTVNGIVDLCPDLSISKSHTGNFTAGSQGTYTITVQNVGIAATVLPITVRDILPAELSYVSATGSGWTVLSSVGQTVTLQTSAVVSPGISLPPISLVVNANAAGNVVNTATVTVTGDISDVNNTALDTTIIEPGSGGGTPDLTISKSHTGDFTAGNLHSYTINVQNSGDGATSGPITVVDTLPTGMTYVSHSNASWQLVSAVGSTITLQNLGTVAAGNSLPTLTLNVNVGAGAVGTPTNTVTVSTPGESNTSNNTATDPTTVLGGGGGGAPDLAISKSHTGDFVAGNVHTYSLNVNNVGTGATTGPITVIDTLPAGMSYFSHSGTGWVLVGSPGASVTFQHSGPVAASTSLPTLTLSVNVGTQAIGTVDNVASVTTTGDANSNNNSATDTTVVTSGSGGGSPDLALTKSHVGNFAQGALHSYSLVVQNIGTGATTGPITLADTLPSGMSYVTHSGAGWSLTQINGNTLTFAHASSLPASSTLPTLQINVIASAAGNFTNVATVTTNGDANITNNTANDPTTVTVGSGGGVADLTIDKSHNGNFIINQQGLYTITVSNIGNAASNGVIEVTDTLPTGLTFAAAGGDGWNLIGVPGTTTTFQNVNVVGPGNSLPPLLLSVTTQMTGVVTNTVTVSMTGESNTANNSAVDPTVIGFDFNGDDDDDDDGIPNDDECPNFPNCPNTDDDLTPDYQDPDDDGDGIPTTNECPNFPNCPDSDDDGTPDYLDPDDDGDGVPTANECPNFPNCPDTDSDGTPDYLDPDDDGDGIPTANECPNFPSCPDTDGDGTPNYLDPDDDGDTVFTEYECPNFPNCPDTDGDGAPNYLDPDDDGDSVLTRHERPDPNGDGNPSDARNTDGDANPDYLDPDDDGDLKPTITEQPDPNNDGNPNDAVDSDGDGIPNYLDPDDGSPGTINDGPLYLPLILVRLVEDTPRAAANP